MNILPEHIEKLKLLVENMERVVDIDDGTWLDHLNASQAFLACIGAGPWKIGRRTKIQTGAIKALGNNDLIDAGDINFGFPLQWQRMKVAAMINYLRAYKITMERFVSFIADMNDPTKMLYTITKTKGRAKVLDLYARDYLKVAAFPIDRHVERRLKENDLPVNETYMIELCRAAELDPSKVARLFVGASSFSGNRTIEL